MKTNEPNVAQVMLSQMSAWGIKNIYGVAGDAIIPLLDAIGKQQSIQYYSIRHETSAAFLSSAEGKCTGRLSVCAGTSGPGLANMINGIADAAADQVPMLVITGQVASDKVGTEAKQYIDQSSLISPLAVYSTQLIHPKATVKIINKAITEAYSKKGVAHVAIPKDILTQSCFEKIETPLHLMKTKQQNLDQLQDALTALNAAERPVIYVGQGARTASKQVIALADKLKAGIIESLGGKGVVPADHPFYLGGIGEGGTLESSQLLKQSDCILIVGANWWPEGFVPHSSRLIKIDISPEAIETHHNISLGLVGDATYVLPQLEAQLVEKDRKEWIETVSQTKATIFNLLDQERKLADQVITPQALMAALEAYISSNGIISIDTGDHTIWFNRIFRTKQQWVTFSGKWRTMGYGFPAAISAKLQYPQKEVTALVGDGSFSMTMMELATLSKYNIPIKIILLNNGSLAAEKSKMLQAGLSPFGVHITNPSFAQIAQAYGITGIRIDQPSQLEAGLQQAYQLDKPVLLDVVVTDPPPPLTGLEEKMSTDLVYQ